ncbi:MAG: T9SS type A sorting domain-containing protein [Bacteroidetes bacterium]|nr:T9SS type A sorting domain-containing protein [Bacteroidota bacterium]
MKKLFLAALTVLAFNFNAQVAMSYSATPDSANQSPRAGATGTFQIIYSGGVYTNNSNYSICCMNSRSTAFELYRYNMNIPSTASITGVTASYYITGGNGGPTNYKIDSICLINNFIKVGNYKRDSVSGAGGTFTNGGTSDAWGAALTPAMVNSPHFGFRITLDTYGINTTIVSTFKLTIHYTLPSGIKNNSEVARPVVFCNDRKLFIKQENKQAGKVLITSLAGQMVNEFLIKDENEKMDLSALSPGIYIYHYSSDASRFTGKFIVE